MTHPLDRLQRIDAASRKRPDPTPKAEFETVIQRLENRPRQTDEEQQYEAARKKLAEHLARAEAIKKDIARAIGPRYSPDRATFDGFECTRPDQRAVVNRLCEFALSIHDQVAAGRNLILFGTVGTGKDHLLAALLYAAADAGFASHWINGLDLYGSWRDQIDAGASESSMVRVYAEYPILAISDPIPPLGSPSAWNVGQLYRIIDARYRAMRPTWLTMNSSGDADAETNLSVPVFDRLKDDAEVIQCRWPSYRERKN